MNIAVNSVGDLVLNRINNSNSFSIFSIHNNSLNILNESGNLITIANPTIGGGPFIISLAHRISFSDFKKNTAVNIGKRSIRLGDLTLNLEQPRIYNSHFDLFNTEHRPIYWSARRAEILKFYEQTEYWDFYKTIFLKKTDNIALLQIPSLIGLGYGATPTGDDFISGYLLGFFSNSMKVPDYLRSRIVNRLDKTNYISANYIKAALTGRINEKIKKSLEKLYLGRKIECFNNEERFGYTSEYDLLLGLTENMLRLYRNN